MRSLKVLQGSLCAALVLSAAPAVAKTPTLTNAQIIEKITQLEQEIALLKQQAAIKEAEAQAEKEKNASVAQQLALVQRQAEVREEVTKAAAAKNATVELGQKGLIVTAPDKNLQFRLSGYAQFDARTFLNDRGNTGKDDFLLRALRPTIELNAYKDFSFVLSPDFGGGTTRVFDAYADFKLDDAFKLRFGKMKPPLGLERWQSPTDAFFIERGQTTNLVPNRDIGLQIYGDIIQDVLEYQLGIFNGTQDLGNPDGDDDDKKEYVARVFAQPFQRSDVLSLRGLGVGIAGSIGDRDGTPTKTILGDYRTVGQQPFFTYLTGTPTSTVYANGTQWRVIPQAYYYYNNIGMMAEYAISAQDVRKGSSATSLKNTAWQLTAGYVLTGEDLNFKGGVIPRAKFNPKQHQWGAFEVLARVGETDIDNKAFPVFADSTKSASKASSVGTGASWYPNEDFKFSINYDWTTFHGGGIANTDRPNENALFARTQFRF
jgi:phosphate-selective porin OprO/OprP